MTTDPENHSRFFRRFPLFFSVRPPRSPLFCNACRGPLCRRKRQALSHGPVSLPPPRPSEVCTFRLVPTLFAWPFFLRDQPSQEMLAFPLRSSSLPAWVGIIPPPCFSPVVPKQIQALIKLLASSLFSSPITGFTFFPRSYHP